MPGVELLDTGSGDPELMPGLHTPTQATLDGGPGADGDSDEWGGYGDDGTGYIPTAEAYLQGGYEPTVALTGPKSDAMLTQAVAGLLRARK